MSETAAVTDWGARTKARVVLRRLRHVLPVERFSRSEKEGLVDVVAQSLTEQDETARAVIHHMALMLSDYGRHEPECVCSGDQALHAADCKDCDCGLREAIEFGVEQSGLPLEPPEASPEESERMTTRGVEIVNGLLARYGRAAK